MSEEEYLELCLEQLVLREKHGIIVCIDYSTNLLFRGEIYIKGKTRQVISQDEDNDLGYDTYEEALAKTIDEAGKLKMIDNVQSAA